VVSGRPYHQDDRGHDGGVVFFSPQPYARDFRCLPEVSVEVLPRVELHVARSSGHGVHIVSDEDIDAPTAATAGGSDSADEFYGGGVGGGKGGLAFEGQNYFFHASRNGDGVETNAPARRGAYGSAATAATATPASAADGTPQWSDNDGGSAAASPGTKAHVKTRLARRASMFTGWRDI